MRIGTISPASIASLRLVALFVLLLPGIASAQVPALPGSVDPSRATPDVVRERPEADRPPAPGLRVEPPVPPPAEEIKFRAVLSEVRFTGVTVYAESDLLGLWAGLRGQEITEKDAAALADAVAEKYRRDGYLIVWAVPAPPDAAGVLHLRVVEGYVATVLFEGDDTTRQPLLRTYADKIKVSRPLRADVLDRYLQLMSDLSGLAITGRLQPPPDPAGAEILIVTVAYKPFNFLGTVNNRGSRFAGPVIASVGLRQNSQLLGTHDQASLRLYTAIPHTDQLYALEAAARHPLGTEGTTLSGGLTLARVRPGFTLKPFEIDGTSKEAFLSVVHPWIRLERASFWTFVSFTYLDSETDSFGTQFLEDRIRALRLGATYIRRDSWRGINRFSAQVSRGLDILNATASDSSLRSRTDGRTEFTKLTADVLRLQPISDRWSVLGAITAQYAFDPLFNPERIGLGGADFLRAYDQAEILGDHGAALKVELRYQGVSDSLVRLEYQWYGYYDLGAVWTKNAAPGTDSRTSAAAAGLGIRFRATRILSGYAEIGWPLTRPVGTTGSNNPRGFFGLTVQF